MARPKYFYEIAKEYGISANTLRRWLVNKPFTKKKHKKLLSPIEIQEIYDALGEP